MGRDDIQNWLQIAGFVGVIASLLFVGQQLRLDRQIAQAENDQAVVSLNYDFLTTLGSDPDLARIWSTYFSQPGELSGDELRQGQFLFASMLRRLEGIYIQNEQGMLSPEGWQSQLETFTQISNSAGYSEFTTSSRQFFIRQDFHDYLESLREAE